MPKNMSFEDRFRQKFSVKPNGCWDWTGSMNGHGYGRFQSEQRRVVQAHRWAYEHFIGPIGKGLDLDHLCRNPACVNPAHMEPVTRRENLLRGKTIPAMLAAKTHCVAGHEFNEANTYRYGVDNRLRVCRVCNRERKRKGRQKKNG